MKTSTCILLLIAQPFLAFGEEGSYELIGKELYEPQTLINDVAAMDWDLHFIKNELDRGTETGLKNARRMYLEGAHSESYAEVVLQKGFAEAIPEGMKVVGQPYDVNYTGLVEGTVMEIVEAEGRVLKVRYDVDKVQEKYLSCLVGGRFRAITNGCFAEFGLMSFPELNNAQVNYTNDVLKGNMNLRTLQSLGTQARETMWDCTNCPYSTYRKYHSYYGRFEYANHIVESAFAMSATDLQRGNQDFSIYDYRGDGGLTEILENSILLLNVWMHVIGELETAIDACVQGNTEDGITFWDEAVAFYAGSRSKLPGQNGNMLFELADKRCREFKTCGQHANTTNGTAWVNYEAMWQFQNGLTKIQSNECEDARDNKDRLERLMTIPLVQGLLRFAHIIAEEPYNPQHAARGAAFAMAVVPLVHHCDAGDATVIYENLRARPNPKVDFEAVRDALERNYDCMEVPGSKVSGIWDEDTGTWAAMASPYDPSRIVNRGDSTQAIITAAAVAGSVIGALLFVIVCARCKRRGNKEADTGDESRRHGSGPSSTKDGIVLDSPADMFDVDVDESQQQPQGEQA